MKTTTSILFLLFLNGCVQNIAFFGPAVTVASTGNVYQGALSYGSNKMINNITGKTTIENIQVLLMPKQNDSKNVSFVKKKIKKLSKIHELSNQ